MPLFTTNNRRSKKFVSNTMRTLATTTHSIGDRQADDYYATDPVAIDLLVEPDYIRLQNDIWEPCCGEGHLSKRLIDYGYNVRSSDLVDRGFGEVCDFLLCEKEWHGDIVTNPPYKIALEICQHALDVCTHGSTVAMFLKLQFLEGKERKQWFKMNPPKYVMVCSSRVTCAKDGRFDLYKGSAVCYAWFVWQKGYTGDTVIKWIN